MDIHKAQALATLMLKEHGLDDWRIELRSYKSTGGMTYYGTRRIGLSRLLLPKWTEDQVRQVMLHEIAHALVGPHQNHNDTWLSKAREIGYKGKGTHNFPTVDRRWHVVCPNHGVIGKRHRRGARGRVYSCTTCGDVVSWVDAGMTQVSSA